VAEEIQSQYKAAGERAGERVEVAIGPGDLWYLAGDRMRRHQQVLLFASEKLNVPNLVRQDLKNPHLPLSLNVTVIGFGLKAFSNKIRGKPRGFHGIFGECLLFLVISNFESEFWLWVFS